MAWDSPGEGGWVFGQRYLCFLDGKNGTNKITRIPSFHLGRQIVSCCAVGVSTLTLRGSRTRVTAASPPWWGALCPKHSHCHWLLLVLADLSCCQGKNVKNGKWIKRMWRHELRSRLWLPKPAGLTCALRHMCDLVMWRVNQVWLVVEYHLTHNLTTLFLAADVFLQSRGDSTPLVSSF